MPSLVSRVDSFCNFALDAGLEVGSSALFLSAVFGCYSHLLVVPLHSHMSRQLSSLACVISRSQRSKLSLQIHRNSKTYQALHPSHVQRRAIHSSERSSPNVPPCPLYRPHPLKVRLRVPLSLLHLPHYRPRIRPPHPPLLASGSHPSSQCSFISFGLLCHHPLRPPHLLRPYFTP